MSNDPYFKIMVNADRQAYPAETPEKLYQVLKGLRKLRLYHWKMVLRCSRSIAGLERQIETDKKLKLSMPREAENLILAKASHRFHMEQVQFLNEFFAIGDTAEGDAAK